jgi:hypothetical protein
MSQADGSIYLRIMIGLLVLNIVGWAWTICTVAEGVAVIEASVPAEDGQASRPDESSLVASASDTEAPVVNVAPAAGLNVRGVTAPPLCAADDVDLDGDARVIGVARDGETRAYLIEAFEVHRVTRPEDLGAHVVNDILGGQSIAVTYCNRTHSTRVLTAGSGAEHRQHPIDLRVGGWFNGMVLVLDGVRYHHHSTRLPLDDVEFVTTTWKEWRTEHPKTLVYTGGECGR